MQEEEKLAQLNKTRWIATSLLALMAVVFFCAKLLQPAYESLSFVSAFAEAAMVGALADWFAVTALFKKPLGLPIPHTAIIPKNKNRVGESIANFLQHNLITEEVVKEELKKVDFAEAAAQWLMQPENIRTICTHIVNYAPILFSKIEDEEIILFTKNKIATALKNGRVAPFLGELLSVLVAEKRHQILFSYLIGTAITVLNENKFNIRQKIHEKSPRWIPRLIDDKFFTRLLNELQNTLSEMEDNNSEWRYRFELAIKEFIEKLRTLPEYEEKIQTTIAEILDHPLFQDYLNQIWQDVKSHLTIRMTPEKSPIFFKLEEAFRILRESLMEDPNIQHHLNQSIHMFVTMAIIKRRAAIADLVKRVIQKWDAETVSRKLELYVGRDLQYIRINGTLVGGLVGLILHIISLAL